MLLLALVALAMTPPAAPPQTVNGGVVVEEVLAVVGRSPILSSDLALAALIRLAEPAAGESPDSYRERLLDIRLRLELQYRDLESSGTLYRLEPDLETSLIELSGRAGGKEELQAGLESHGLTWDDLEHLALRVAVVNTYVEQRLRPRIAVSFEELQREYRLLSEKLEQSGAAVPSFDELQDRLYELLVERKLNAEIEHWLEQSRERLEVTRFAR